MKSSAEQPQHLVDVEVVEVVVVAEATKAVANGHYRFLDR